MTAKRQSGGKNGTITDVLAAIDDERTVSDSRVLIQLMRRISGKRPKVWNVGTIGFDSYRYSYDSGREGECQIIGFYPRKGKFTVYLMDGTAKHGDLLKQLGKHTTSRVCLYFKRLSDLQLPVLERILKHSYDYVKSRDGQMHRVM